MGPAGALTSPQEDPPAVEDLWTGARDLWRDRDDLWTTRRTAKKSQEIDQSPLCDVAQVT
jgi:hypothetical protein